MKTVAIAEMSPDRSKPASTFSGRKNRLNVDRIFKGVLVFFASSIVAVLLAIFLEMIRSSSLSLKTFGFAFLLGRTWDPVKETFGALPFIYGTLVTSLIAMAIAVPVALGVALFLTEWARAWVRTIASFLVELLAAIPSVIYGLWAIFVMIPFLRNHIYPFVTKMFGFLPFFKGPFYGVSLLSGGVILSIMILPTIASVSKEVFLSVPQEMREAVLALGGTRWEAIRLAVIKMSRSGIIGAIFLGLGRALGETMAVTMVIGNRPELGASVFSPGYSLASVIANEFSEATSPLHLSALTEMGLILLGITFLVNGVARLLVARRMPVASTENRFRRGVRQWMNSLFAAFSFLAKVLGSLALLLLWGYLVYGAVAALHSYLIALSSEYLIILSSFVAIGFGIGVPVAVISAVLVAKFGKGPFSNSVRYHLRNWTNRNFTLLCGASCLLSFVVLALLLGYVVYQGASAVNFDFFTHLPAPVGEVGGGMANAIVGTLILVGLASTIGIPVGIGTGLYLAEYGNGRFAKLVRYLTDVLNGLPSIVMGIFAYAVLVIPMRGFSGLAGGVALSILMIPVIVRTTEEVVKLVPNNLREGALALGIPRWKVILRIVLSTAKGGLITGVVLGVARIMGETAPLLFTAFGNQFWQTSIFQPMAAMTLQIFNYSISPYEDWHAQAWAGALVLVTMSLVINIIARFFTMKNLKALR